MAGPALAGCISTCLGRSRPLGAPHCLLSGHRVSAPSPEGSCREGPNEVLGHWQPYGPQFPPLHSRTTGLSSGLRWGLYSCSRVALGQAPSLSEFAQVLSGCCTGCHLREGLASTPCGRGGMVGPPRTGPWRAEGPAPMPPPSSHRASHCSSCAAPTTWCTCTAAPTPAPCWPTCCST